MPRSSHYATYSDSRLITMWRGHDGLADDEREALRAEMNDRGLFFLVDPTASDPGRAPRVVVERCPACGGGLVEGDLALELEPGSGGGRELVELANRLEYAGTSRSCYFRPRDGDALRVLSADERRGAMLCAECGTIVIRG